jgi:hypothetical protein
MKQWGLLDSLRPNQLTDCEVPLAIVFWTDQDGINFIDMWSARRSLTRSSADVAWPFITSDRRTAEGEAMYLQFQSQIKDLMTAGTDLSVIKASDIFGFLPPVGMLPVGSATSFNYDVFFSEMTSRDPIFIEGAQLRPLIREAFNYPPIDTSGQIVVAIRGSGNAQAAPASANPPQSYIVFATDIPVSGRSTLRHTPLELWQFFVRRFRDGPVT